MCSHTTSTKQLSFDRAYFELMFVYCLKKRKKKAENKKFYQKLGIKDWPCDMHRLFFIPLFSFYLFCHLSLVTNYFYLFAFTWITFTLITFTWSPYKKSHIPICYQNKTKKRKSKEARYLGWKKPPFILIGFLFFQRLYRCVATARVSAAE